MVLVGVGACYLLGRASFPVTPVWISLPDPTPYGGLFLALPCLASRLLVWHCALSIPPLGLCTLIIQPPCQSKAYLCEACLMCQSQGRGLTAHPQPALPRSTPLFPPRCHSPQLDVLLTRAGLGENATRLEGRSEGRYVNTPPARNSFKVSWKRIQFLWTLAVEELTFLTLVFYYFFIF